MADHIEMMGSCVQGDQTEISDDVLRTRWDQVGRHLSGKRLSALCAGVSSASPSKEAYVVVLLEMSRRQLSL